MNARVPAAVPEAERSQAVRAQLALREMILAGELPAGSRIAELAVVERPALRLAGTDFGIPSPYLFIPPAYFHVNLIYDTLLLHDSTGALVPWLASSYERSANGSAYTFQLREGVRWQDGQPFTADDVVFSFDYFRQQAETGLVAPWVIFRPSNVVAASRIGERAVEVRLDKPVVTFLDNVAARFPIVPRHVWSRIPAAGQAESRDVLLGTGPYRFEDYSAAEGSYLFVANDDHFLGAPFVRRIELVPVGDQLTALAAGEIDAVSLQAAPTNRTALDRFRNDSCFGFVEGPADFLAALNWDLSKGGALADVRFRHACALAIDRSELVRRLLGGAGHPGNPGFLPPGHPLRVEVEQYSHDPAAANQLLDAAGYRRGSDGVRRGADGKALSFRLGHLAELAQAARLVVDALGAVGVELKLQEIPLFPLPDYDMALIVYAGVVGDPDFMRRVFSSRVDDKLFFAAKGYANAELDDLAERQQVMRDDAQRAELVAHMQRIVAADLPVLHLYYPTPFFLFRRSVFDQWTYSRTGGILNKQQLVTGTGTGGAEIRPVKEGAGQSDTTASRRSWTDDLPEGFPIPEGAVHRITAERVSGKEVQLIVAQEPDQVEAFYRRELPDAGWALERDLRLVTRGNQSLSLSIIPYAEGGGGTLVRITENKR